MTYKASKLGQLFPGGLQGNFQLISRLRLWLELVSVFEHGAPDLH